MSVIVFILFPFSQPLIALCSDVNQQAFEVFDLAVILYDNEYFVNHCHVNFCFFLHLDERVPSLTLGKGCK